MVHLVTALVGYVCAGIFLYTGLNSSSWSLLFLAAAFMAVGNYNIKRYKQNQQ